MENEMKKGKQIPELLSGLLGRLERFKYVLVVLLLGAALMVAPSFGDGGGGESEPQSGTSGGFDLEAFEARVEKALSEISGTGKLSLTLSLDSGVEKVLAADSDSSEQSGGDGERQSELRLETLVITQDSGESTVVLREVYPSFKGALVVCEGAGSPEIRLAVTEAVSALTGLGSDKISVVKMQSAS